jgi:V8-like Glu-specific endopeptidase
MSARPWHLVLVVLGLFIIQQALAARNINSLAPKVIYGADDRMDYYQVQNDDMKTLADSTVALVRAASLDITGNVVNYKTTPYGASLGLCASEPFFNQETLAFCSGSLVAPDIIMTAGHCIRNQQACDSTKFVFGFRLNDAVSLPKTTSADMVFSCKTLIHSVADPAGEDFALVRLDRAVTHTKPLSYRTSGALLPGDGLKVMGHPAGLPLKVAGGATVRALKGQFLVANLDTYGGNSGSAVFNDVDGQIEGVLVRGEVDYVYKNGCRVSNECALDACRGEDVTLMERVLPILNGALSNP